MQIGLAWLTRGQDASFLPAITLSPKLAAGWDVSAGVTAGGYTYLGPVNELNRSFLETSLNDGDINVELNAGGSFLGKASLTGTYSPTANTVGMYGEFGASATPGVTWSLGISNTYVLKDFASSK